ncbi:MAG TPA: CheR family methyltransferase [Gemmatimonadales bacterium]
MKESVRQSGEAADPQFEGLLEYLKRSRGFDFTAYKRSSLMRRVQVRMHAAGITDFINYRDFLEVDPEEFTRLFNTILINVTTFFRDGPPVWDYLAQNVLPGIVEQSESTKRIRVWSAGCASGDEAYSVAILLAESLGSDRFRERVKIYATDVDEDALSEARQAAYAERALEEVPPALLQKYFDRVGDRYVFHKDLRRAVLFGRHDLIQDAPISRIDLLLCRNCMMYFNAQAQSRILAKFQFSLREGGVLFLGKAETLLTRAATFTPLDVTRRLFIKPARPDSPKRASVYEPTRSHRLEPVHSRLRQGAADVSPVAHLILDRQGTIVEFNQQLRTLFGVTARDIGRPFQDLELSYRPFELRSTVEQAYSERGSVSVTTTTVWTTPGGYVVTLELLVVPLPDERGGYLGAALFFTDVTRQRRLQDGVQRASQELETALEELQSTNEELETTNEELQATVEKLETTNEELQSTNEELETMNEELQSTNQELQAINQESSTRSDEVANLNAFLEGILTSLRGAVVVVDRDLRVMKWNHRAEDLWGLRAQQVLSMNFLNLDSRMPVDQLRTPIRACLAREAEFLETTVEAVNRRGQPIRIRVHCTALDGTPHEAPRGAILVMEETSATS